MSKICKNCGAYLPEGAAFCPHCATEQVERQEVKVPRLWRKWALLGVVLAVILAVIALATALYHAPVTYEGNGEIVYKDGDAVYHVLVTFSAMDGVMKTCEPEKTIEIAQGASSGIPAQLYIYQEGTDEAVWSAFMEQVESYSMEVEALDGARKADVAGPAYTESFPYAALKADVLYHSDCGTNEITWTLNMKNGDILKLYQSFHIIEVEMVSYYPETVPMDTAEELQTLLDQIEQEADADTAVCIYLPPVTYDGEIKIGAGSYTFYGGSDGENRTTFAATVSVDAKPDQFVEIYGVQFIGSGGVGLSANSSVFLIDCVIEGWDVGAISKDGSWVGAINSIFRNNKVGLQLDTYQSACSAPIYRNNVFADNEIGFLITNLFSTQVVTFPETVFSGNGEDIVNSIDHPVDTSGAKFE